MKDDYRDYIVQIPTPYYSPEGIPGAETNETLTCWWLEGRLKIVFCQRCWTPFLVWKNFWGDPPFHDEPHIEDMPCAGNTMLHIRLEEEELDDGALLAKKARELLHQFWDRKMAAEWRLKAKKREKL